MKLRRGTVKNIRKALRGDEYRKIRKILSRLQHADIASLLKQLEKEERLKGFNFLSLDKKVKVFEHLSADIQQEILNRLGREDTAEVLNEMQPDDRADLFAQLPDDVANDLLPLMKSEEAEDVKELLEYGEDTAGGRMTTEFISLDREMTSRQALVTLQKKAEKGKTRNIYAVYTVDKSGRLQAGFSLQRLIASNPDDKIEDLSRPVDRIKVKVNDDQEQVAHLFEHYDLLSVPVVDENDCLVGVITIDDIIDVIQEETGEDMALHAGIDEADYDTVNIGKSVKTRGPWLMTSFVGGLAAAVIIGFFEGALEKVAAIAVFIPIIMDMGGNVGVQSSTVVVRRLALEKDVKKWSNAVAGELRSGLLMSVGFGVLLWAFAAWRYSPAIGRASGLGIAVALVMSTCLGAFLPVIFYKKDIDPAVSTGPLITTAIDVLGLGIYFLLAMWIVL